MLLRDLIDAGFGEDKDFNCAEKILYGANQAYDLGLSEDCMKMSAGFGRGMGIESVCGALTAGIMVLSKLAVKKNAHESTRIKELAQEYFAKYNKEMKHIDCKSLMADYRTETMKCKVVILKSAEILDKLIQREFTNARR